MNTKLFFVIDAVQLGTLFYLTYSKVSALFFFALGIPLGLLVVDQNPHRRLLYINTVVIPLLEFFSTFFAHYWFFYTFEGIVNVIAIQQKFTVNNLN